MNKIIIILLAVVSLFCNCSKQRNDSPCDCIKKENRKKKPDKKDKVFPTGKLIITEGRCFPDVVDKYLYPVKYPSEQWYQMTEEERMDACQLPDDVLKSISTLGLIQSFVDLPYDISDMVFYFYNTTTYHQLTYSLIFKHFNSIEELLTREDAAKSLILYLSATKLDCLESFIDIERREFINRLLGFEYLFTKLEILDMLSHRDKVNAVGLLLAIYKQWKSLGYRGSSIVPVLAYIMYDDILPCVDEEVINSAVRENYSEEKYSEVVAYAECFIK